MKTFLRSLCLLQIFFATCLSARIFGFFPTPSISHQVVFRALTEELARRGHHLVIITTDPVNSTEPEYDNITQIDTHDFSYKHWEGTFNFANLRKEIPNPIAIVSMYMDVMSNVADDLFSFPPVKKLLTIPDESFDLCFIEAFVPIVGLIKERFNCSVIVISPFYGLLQNHDSVGNPAHPFYYRDVFSPYLEEQINIWQKIVLLLIHYYYKYMYHVVGLPRFDGIIKKHFGPNVNSADSDSDYVDMLFLNSYQLFNEVRPSVPAVVYLGSIHINPPKPLPTDLQTIMDCATNGVVYFSLGSNMKSNQLPAETRKIFLDALREMPYTVLWKWEYDTLPDQPANVFTSKWLPQNDLLSHPNMKAFISQVGLQSMEEAIHHSVPIVGIPFFADHECHAWNRKALVHRNIDKETVDDTVREVINNPRYHENVVSLRDKMYEQPQTSLERAVWWTEYVLRHGGAKHLRSPGYNVPFYQYFMLDVLAVVTLILAFFTVLFALLLRWIRNNITSVLHMNYDDPKSKIS